MKFQKTLRIRLIVAGLGAALLLPVSVRAQQEVDPTTFDVNPGTPQVNQASVIQQAQNVAAEAKTEATAPATAQANAGAHIIAGNSLIWLVLVAFAGIVLRGIAKVRRQRMVQGAR